jgi:CRP-like cAMP-binding protein
VAVYQQGMWFGDFEVYKNVGRLFSCVSMTDVELFALTKKDFKRIFFQEYVDFGNYFLHKMDVNFENLENTMEIVYHILFPESATRTVDIKLDIIKNQRKMISQINEIKHNQLRGKKKLIFVTNKKKKNTISHI